MNESLRFPVLTLCNKNIFNVSRIRRLLEWMNEEAMAVNVTTDGNETMSSRPPPVLVQPVGRTWDVGRLVGFRGMDVQQVWDAVAHSAEEIVIEVDNDLSFHFLQVPFRLTCPSLLVLVREERELQPGGRMEARLHLHGQMLLLHTK